MSIEDFGKMIGRSLFLSLDRIVAPRLIKVLYLSGVAALILWALNHFFSTFRFGFGDGLWGLLEIGVFGLFGMVVLRTICEALIVYFTANESAVAAANDPAVQTNLLDEMRDAIDDLASNDVGDLLAGDGPTQAPATSSKSSSAAAKVSKPKLVKRTAKRAPPKAKS